jgi:hypothetical protein
MTNVMEFAMPEDEKPSAQPDPNDEWNPENLTCDPSVLPSKDMMSTPTFMPQTRIEVRKPKHHIRTNPKFRARDLPFLEGSMGTLMLLDRKLLKKLHPVVLTKVKLIHLALYVVADGTWYFWPYKTTSNTWGDAAMDAITTAETLWVRPVADIENGTYRLEPPLPGSPLLQKEPVWPDKPMSELLRMAFEGKKITSLEHELIRKIMYGE